MYEEEVYHFDYPSCRLQLRGVVGLCHACHNYIHDGRMENLENAGLFDPDKREAILRRGENILKKAGYSQFKIDDDQLTPEWPQWHIVIQGKAYHSRYESVEEWREYFSHINENDLKDTPETWETWKEEYHG